MKRHHVLIIVLSLVLFACTTPVTYDIILAGGTVYDGSGDKPYQADIGIIGDSIAFIGKIDKKVAKRVIEARGLAYSN